MKVIVGLGNPGAEYAGTRHNAGVMCVDVLSAGRQAPGSYGWRRQKDIFVFGAPELVLVKTAGVFMNESGRLFSNFKFQISNLYVAHDDLDLRLGEYKIGKGKGPKEHNGVLSVERALGTKDFWRIRIGVDNRSQGSGAGSRGEEYVLQKFMPEERGILDEVMEKICDQLNKF